MSNGRMSQQILVTKLFVQQFHWLANLDSITAQVVKNKRNRIFEKCIALFYPQFHSLQNTIATNK
ncbi:hypothetical protein BLOT_000016 [Blomia tropicalis]|nr:hypothetical protein BLOT_000016 [Blomia tropicalis]